MRGQSYVFLLCFCCCVQFCHLAQPNTLFHRRGHDVVSFPWSNSCACVPFCVAQDICVTGHLLVNSHCCLKDRCRCVLLRRSCKSVFRDMAQEQVPNVLLQPFLSRPDHIEYGLVREQARKIEMHAQKLEDANKTIGSIQKARRLQADEAERAGPAQLPMPAPAQALWVTASHRGPGDRSPSIIPLDPYPIDSPSQEARWGLSSPGARAPTAPRAASAGPTLQAASTSIARRNLLEQVVAKQQFCETPVLQFMSFFINMMAPCTVHYKCLMKTGHNMLRLSAISV